MTQTMFVPLHDKPKRKDCPNVGWMILENGCHQWMGGNNGSGYGKVWWDGRKQYIHRLRYEWTFGPIPDGLVLDHYVCGNRSCCNPLHVRPVTIRENVLRSESGPAQCASKTHCKRGHPLEGDNLTPTGKRIGQRRCRTCERKSQRARRLTNRDVQ